MNETKHNTTVGYFTERIDHFKNLIRCLNSDDRTDEAVFAKIQMNVYDIFNTIFSAAIKTSGQNDGEAVQFFLTKLDQIPKNWRNSLAGAQAHGDAEKAHIERIKLDTAEEIGKVFKKIWEVNP